MRISDNMLTKNFLTSVNNSRSRMSKLQDQLSSGKRVLNPSDDPEAAYRILRTKTAINKNEQFQKNVSDGTVMLQATAQAIDNFSNLLLEAKDIVTKARSGIGTTSLQTFAEQIDAIIKSAVQIGNTQFNGKHLFGGTQTTAPPFILAADGSSVTLNPNGISGTIELQVGDGLKQAVNIDGMQAFLGEEIFQALIDIRDTMRGGTVPTAAHYDQVTAHVSHVSSVGGKVGLMMNALEMHENFLAGREIQLTSLLSNDEDTDFAESTLLLRKEEIMLEAALNVGARLIPKSLMDFLR
ncbi:MAG: flagellar hook-associated protein FlgL [Bacteroidetes bacterium]|nr:flagellar hook-associated protein FlgL [Bacteroidota bacterium]MCW5895081.1 flagellar hook-associated protein FlgL [Bacteroidota bacterium]